MAGAAALLAHVTWMAACGPGAAPGVASRAAAPWHAARDAQAAPVPAPPSHAIELARCVALTNEYRAGVSKPPLRVSAALEAYAAAAARHDGLAHRPHRYFDRTDGGGVALAENLVPWWSLARRHSVAAIVEDGLAFMWAEGPGGDHYRNMVGPYTELGCGLFVNGDEVTLVQAFR